MRQFFRRLFAGNVVEEPSALTAAITRNAESVAESHASTTDIETAFHAFVLGASEASAGALTPREKATLRRLNEACSGDRYDPGELPRLPDVLPLLLSSLRSDDVAIAALTQQVGRDPVLVGEVIRVANSPYYRTSKPIDSLRQAIVVLGQDGLRRVVASALLKPIHRSGTGAFSRVAGDRVWAHSERCAHACTVLGKGVCDDFEAYLAGTVAHIGAIAVTRVLDRDADAVRGAYSAAFIAGYARHARRLSVRIARYWQFPAPVVSALDQRVRAVTQQGASPLTRILNAADLLSMRSLLDDEADDARVASLDPALLGVSSPLLAACANDLKRRFSPEPESA